MKKLLALMLVLGMATVANATVILSFNDDTSVEEADVCINGTAILDISSDDASNYGAWIALLDEGGSEATNGEFTGNYTIYDEAGSSASVDLSYLPAWVYGEALAFPPAVVTPGKHFDFEFKCLGAGDVYVVLYDADGVTVLDTMTIHQVPEPASMLLLGLGGLLLRRRK